MTLPQLQDCARSGELRAEDLVWNDSMPEWKPASDIAAIEFSIGQEPSKAHQSCPQASDSIFVTSRALLLLSQTRPWMLFVGIVSIVLGIIAGLIALLLTLLLFITQEGLLGMAGNAVAYAASAAWSLGVGVLLIRYAASVKLLLAHHQSIHLEEALAEQKSLWQVIGGTVILGVVVLGAGILIIIVLALAAALSG